MKRRTQAIAVCLAAAAVFLLWMWRGLTPPAPQPGFMASGGMTEPLGVAVGALMKETTEVRASVDFEV